MPVRRCHFPVLNIDRTCRETRYKRPACTMRVILQKRIFVFQFFRAEFHQVEAGICIDVVDTRMKNAAFSTFRYRLCIWRNLANVGIGGLPS